MRVVHRVRVLLGGPPERVEVVGGVRGGGVAGKEAEEGVQVLVVDAGLAAELVLDGDREGLDLKSVH